MRKRLGPLFVASPWKAAVAVCLLAVMLAIAFGALVPWPFLQNAAADFVGGLLAGLLIFALADAALGLTERREKERHAVQMAYTMLLLEMLDNQTELRRIVNALRAGSLTVEDPVFWETERVKAENWQLLAQGPLVEHLSPDLFMDINISYHTSRSFVNTLSKAGRALGPSGHQAWKDFCNRHAMRGESALEFWTTAHEKLRSELESLQGR